MKIKKSVQASAISDVTSILKKLLDTIFKGIDKLFESTGYEKVDEKVVEENGKQVSYSTYESGNGDKVEVQVSPVENKKGYFDIHIDTKGHKSLDKKSVPESKIEKIIDDYIDSELGATNEGRLESSKRVQVTLKKVNAGKDIELHLCTINANYNIVAAYNNLQDVLSDDEFLNSLDDDKEFESFEITETEDGEGFDVKALPDTQLSPDTNTSYMDMFAACVNLRNNLQYLHWGAKGHKFMEMHQQIDSILWNVSSYVDVTAELLVEKQGYVPHPGQVTYVEELNSDGLDFESGLIYAAKCVTYFLDVMEAHYVNMDHDVQSVLDNWIRDMKKWKDYFIERQLSN